MISFKEYASEKQILDLLIKERVKVALKSKLQNISPNSIADKLQKEESLTISEHIALLMPARNLWHRPYKGDRFNKNSKEKKSRKQVLTRSIALTIRNHRKNYDKYPYLKRLDEFIKLIQKEIDCNNHIIFNSIKIVGKKKKIDADGITILRPLCVFDSLRDKILISLASKYLSEVFDSLLHEEVLSYRPLRIYHNSKQPILTNRDNAIENLLRYCKKHRGKSIYVTECDIQKYFDTINHDVIRECFNEFAKKAKASNPKFDYEPVQPIVETYLNSYSFYNKVAVNNEELLQLTHPCMYEEPNKDLFIEYGCYTRNELDKSLNKIGIPQGGALSGLISNIVLSTIDTESILKEEDEERFFCRYGDDIILAHTSKEKVKELITSYKDTLTKKKLLHHEFVSVTDENFRKANGKTRPILWEQKSRNPYLWGRSENEKESVDWIGFLGYEIRYTGEIRLRRSSLNDKMRSIKYKYYRSSNTKTAKGLLQKKTFNKLERKVIKQIDKFAGEGLKSAKSLTQNKYSVTQAKKLNQYTSRHIYKLLYKIIKRNNLDSNLLNQWWQIAKDKDCMNYIKTLKHKN